MQHLGCNFNDLPASPLHAGFGGVGGSGPTSAKADGGSAASAIPMDQEAVSKYEGNPDVFIVQANPSARQGAAGGKRSLEANVATRSGAVPKRPRLACTLRSGKCNLEVIPCSLTIIVF
jgi:hypothetical protein